MFRNYLGDISWTFSFKLMKGKKVSHWTPMRIAFHPTTRISITGMTSQNLPLKTIIFTWRKWGSIPCLGLQKMIAPLVVGSEQQERMKGFVGQARGHSLHQQWFPKGARAEWNQIGGVLVSNPRFRHSLHSPPWRCSGWFACTQMLMRMQPWHVPGSKRYPVLLGPATSLPLRWWNPLGCFSIWWWDQHLGLPTHIAGRIWHGIHIRFTWPCVAICGFLRNAERIN